MLLLYQTIDQLKARLEELRPMVDEAREIEAALAAIEGAQSPPSGGERMSLAQRKRQIVNGLRSRPDARVRDIADEISVTDARVTQILKLMEAEQTLVRRNGKIELL